MALYRKRVGLVYLYESSTSYVLFKRIKCQILSGVHKVWLVNHSFRKKVKMYACCLTSMTVISVRLSFGGDLI